MLEAFATSSIVAWPLALTLATVVVSDRARRRRRRELLNRSLHELRRPLQALTLAQPRPTAAGRDHLGLALEALGELDRRVNGHPRAAASRPELIEARALAADAVRRWRGPAAENGREIDLRWLASASRVLCDRNAVARALDNLIANALEHGHGPIHVEGRVSGRQLRMSVADGSAAGRSTAGSLAGPGRRSAGSRSADRRRDRRRPRRAFRRLRPRRRRQGGYRAAAGGSHKRRRAVSRRVRAVGFAVHRSCVRGARGGIGGWLRRRADGARAPTRRRRCHRSARGTARSQQGSRDGRAGAAPDPRGVRRP